MSTSTAERLSARVTGRVQGVGFRHFVHQRADALGLAGWVRNEDDGSVRLEAEGPRDALEELLADVHEGPQASKVEDVSFEWQDAGGDFDGFTVQR